MKGAIAFGAVAVGLVNAGAYHNTTEELTTSTIYATNVHTITQCPPEVHDCPIGKVTTETIAVSTTVCPVTEVHPTPTPTEWTTSTIYTTNVHTVTKCPPEVIDCPEGPHYTTETIVVGTTVCPVTEDHPAPPTYAPPPYHNNVTSTLYTTEVHTITQCPPEVPNCPIGEVTTTVYATGTTCITVPHSTVILPGTTKVIPQPPPHSAPSQPPASQPPASQPPASQPPVVPTPSAPEVVPSTPAETEPAQVTAGAARFGFEMVAAAAGAAAFFL